VQWLSLSYDDGVANEGDCVNILRLRGISVTNRMSSRHSEWEEKANMKEEVNLKHITLRKFIKNGGISSCCCC